MRSEGESRHGAREARRAPDVIELRGLRVPCIVGVYPSERDSPQRLEVDLRMELDPVLEVHRLRQTLDYAAVASQVAFLLQSCRFFLLETAATALARLLLAPPTRGEEGRPIRAVTVRLTKPDAFGGLGVPSLEIHRDAEDIVIGHEEKPFGEVDVIHETRECGIYRLHVAPGRSIPLHVHRVMQESEMVLSDNLVLNDRPAAVGAVHRWPHDWPHRYDNPSERWGSILCVDVPRFIPEDEIEIKNAPGALATEPPFLTRERELGT